MKLHNILGCLFPFDREMKANGPFAGVLRKAPSNREKGAQFSTEEWLRAKQQDDGADGLWRIHDKIYDFTDFVKNHPGGKYWLEVTKGTDITEAFESHHVTEKAENLLKKFYVKEAKTPRISMITFEENGFYKTLKRKVRKANVIPFTGSTLKSRVFIDSLLFGFFITSVLGIYRSYLWSVVAGVLVYMISVAAHNFFHMKDNFRMYYFNFSLLSYREWRISHVLSHHQFANTFLDLEVSLFEPILQYLPKEDKNLLSRFLPWLFSPLFFLFLLHIEFVKKLLLLVANKKTSLHWDEFLGLTVPLFLWLFTNVGLEKVLISWNITIATGSFFFFLVGLTAAHHHPEIYHEGDYLGDNRDFGILQLAAVRDREEVNGNFFLTMITFGDHALHHMFPTIDHGKLPALTPYLEETCREFNIDFKLKTFGGLFTGMYKQLARNYVNGRLLIEKNKGS